MRRTGSVGSSNKEPRRNPPRDVRKLNPRENPTQLYRQALQKKKTENKTNPEGIDKATHETTTEDSQPLTSTPAPRTENPTYQAEEQESQSSEELDEDILATGVDATQQYWEDTIKEFHDLPLHRQLFLINIDPLDVDVDNYINNLEPFDISQIEIPEQKGKSRTKMATVKDVCELTTLMNGILPLESLHSKHRLNTFISDAAEVEKYIKVDTKGFFYHKLRTRLGPEILAQMGGQQFETVKQLEDILRGLCYYRDIRSLRTAELCACRQQPGESLPLYIARLRGIHNDLCELYDEEYDQAESTILKRELEFQARTAFKLGVADKDIRHVLQKSSAKTLTGLFTEAQDCLQMDRHSGAQPLFMKKTEPEYNIKQEPTANILHVRPEPSLNDVIQSFKEEMKKEVRDIIRSTIGTTATSQPGPSGLISYHQSGPPGQIPYHHNYPDYRHNMTPIQGKDGYHTGEYFTPQSTYQQGISQGAYQNIYPIPYSARRPDTRDGPSINYSSPPRRCHYCQRTGHLVRYCRTRMNDEHNNQRKETNQRQGNNVRFREPEPETASAITTQAGNLGGPVGHPPTGTP